MQSALLVAVQVVLLRVQVVVVVLVLIQQVGLMQQILAP
jgi:hypothetical protein